MQVQCYAGRKADERPVRFRIGESDYMVDDIIEQWYGPDESFYKTRADDGNVYLLRRCTSTGTCGLESVKEQRRPGCNSCVSRAARRACEHGILAHLGSILFSDADFHRAAFGGS